MAYEFNTDQALFMTLDKEEAIAKAKEIFSETDFVHGTERPDFRAVTREMHSVKHCEDYINKNPEKRHNPHSFNNQIFVIATELGTDLRDTKIPKKVIWSPTKSDVFNNFKTEIKALFLYDLHLELADFEVIQLWSKYLKNPKVVNGTVHYANPLNAGYIVQSLKGYQEEKELYELEMKTK